MSFISIFVPVSAFASLLCAYGLASWIGKADEGTDEMKAIADGIKKGAWTFLKKEYQVMIALMAVAIVLLGLFLSWVMAALYACGAVLCMLTRLFGMKAATSASARTANAARENGMNRALRIAFRSGAAIGLCVTGFGLLGVTAIVVNFGVVAAAEVVAGFALGVSSMALFGRICGGIYTKAADAGADLVGQVEAGLPEDDPRNPAVIADNAGDAIEVAGMGTDLFESYVGAIVSAIVLASTLSWIIPRFGGSFPLDSTAGAYFPLLISAIGIIASIVGVMFVRGGASTNPTTAINRGIYISGGIVILCAILASQWLFGTWNCGLAVIAGLLVGVAIGKITKVYTSGKYKSVRRIAAHSQTGPATVIITGFSIGMRATFWPVLCIAAGTLAAGACAGLYGIALAAVGMLSSTGMLVAVGAFGPVADNAGGIAQMAGLPKDVRAITDRLDLVGHTTIAVGSGFAIGSAALTAFALLAAYSNLAGLVGINILSPVVIAGLLIGAMLPFRFSSLTIGAVGKAANSMIEEVRKQFREDRGILEGTATPDYGQCVAISTKAATNAMVAPGLLAIAAPLAVGAFLGVEALGAMLAGAFASGLLLMITMANAGAAWDNAKKHVAGSAAADGGQVSAESRSAAVVGDAVGDPFKDTASPSVNILIKLMTIIAIVFAKVFADSGGLIAF